MSTSIFVATVHWHSEFFIQVQLDALRRYLPAPPRLLAFLDGLPAHWDENFEYVERSDDLKQSTVI